VQAPNVSIEDLRKALTYQSLAFLFGLDPKEMLRDLYRRGSGHKRFLLAKKNGGSRLIESPQRTHRLIQGGLKPILDNLYRPTISAHGFVGGRSVFTNASCHIGRNTLINLDIKSFFHAISFQRVRGLFIAQPFGLPWVVANILAQACCCDGRLSMGGITSPVISNFLSTRLDKRLATLAQKRGGRYTRYCDDVSLSFPGSPLHLPEFVVLNENNAWEVSPHLMSIFTEEGFELNLEKFRVATGSVRKRVTGITVNKKPNLSRSWIRGLGGQIYAIEKFGLDHLALTSFSSLPKEVGRIAALRHVHGKLAYMSMIRGRSDWIVAGLAHRLNKHSSIPSLRIPDIEIINNSKRRSFGLWVVTSHKSTKEAYLLYDGQGTGFTADRGYIFTAAHVVVDDKSKKLFPIVYVRRQDDPCRLYKCDVLKFDLNSDVAILKLCEEQHSLTRIRFAFGGAPSVLEDIDTIGFPAYFPGQDPTVHSHRVMQISVSSGVKKISITGLVQGGLSGAPVLSSQGSVVGMVHRGIGAGGTANEVIDVSHIKKLLFQV
jgi:S1-C subfamily serine protease